MTNGIYLVGEIFEVFAKFLSREWQNSNIEPIVQCNVNGKSLTFSILNEEKKNSLVFFLGKGKMSDQGGEFVLELEWKVLDKREIEIISNLIFSINQILKIKSPSQRTLLDKEKKKKIIWKW